MRNLRISTWQLGLAALVALTSFNVFWHLQQAERSGYYAQVAVSMAQSWHNFFYGAADPMGFLSLDKIPGSFWLPALMVKLIGFHNAAVVAPNGIATVIAVVLIAYSGRTIGGDLVGLLAGFLFSTTPIIGAVARSNEPESAFLLSMSIAALFLSLALTRESRLFLILTGLAIALGFQQYMIEAWAIWPAVALAWWFGIATRPWLTKLIDLAISGAVSLGVSLAWIITVWLTPAGSRPYIGNTLHNSPWEMVFGYNALGRFGNSGKMAGLHSGAVSFKTFTPPFSGHASLIRLFYHQVIGQISWLIPATIVAIVYLWLRHKIPATVLAFGIWFASFAAMFSAVSGMHQYYTATLAIPMALLVAQAAVQMVRNNHRGWLASLALVSGGVALLALKLNPGYLRWFPPVQMILAAALVALWLLRRRFTRIKTGLLVCVVALALGITPAAWSIDAKNHPSFVNPMAGPPDSYTSKLAHHSSSSGALTGHDKNGQTFSQPKISHAKVLDWLKTRPHGGILLAAFGADATAPYVILQAQNLLPIGGFNGADPVPTLDGFRALVKKREVNYVLLNHFIGDEPAYANWESARIKRWVLQNCHKNEHPPQRVTLYYCYAK